MKREHIRIQYAEIDTVLMPRLMGRVFHITCRAYLPSIERAGNIDTNVTGQYATAFGSSINSFFRNRGCVSVFDYQSETAEEIEDFIPRCSPHNAGRHCNWELAVFFLNREAIQCLRSWKEWSQDQAWREMIVPHIEAGHPGPIPLTSIDELLEVSIAYTPSSLELALEESWRLDGRERKHRKR